MSIGRLVAYYVLITLLLGSAVDGFLRDSLEILADFGIETAAVGESGELSAEDREIIDKALQV